MKSNDLLNSIYGWLIGLWCLVWLLLGWVRAANSRPYRDPRKFGQ
jgi:hypothetical protein